MRRVLPGWFSYAASTALILSALVPLGPRRAAAATKCVPNIPASGDVLLTGGVTVGPNGTAKPTGNTEFYHVTTQQWMTGCPSKNAHEEGQLMLWPSAEGMKLIEIGGDNVRDVISNKTDAYDPTTGIFKNGPGVPTPLEDFAAVSLADGSVMVIGGFKNGNRQPALNTAAILGVRSWKRVKAKMTTPRGGLCAAKLTNGQVLIVGGIADRENAVAPNVLSSAERYDPITQTFTLTAQPLNVARTFAQCTLLQDGKVLITGGTDGRGNASNSAEIYDPATDAFTVTTGPMNEPRFDHTATLLPDGTVLVAGGGSGVSNTAEIFDERTRTFTALGLMNDIRDQASATLLGNGTVLIAGGITSTGALNTAEIYDPVAKTFTPTSPMNFTHGDANAAIVP